MSAPQAKMPSEPAAQAASYHDERDADVVELMRRGEKADAIRLLMERHGAAVYRYCSRALRDAALADDVQQQVFIEAFRNLERFSERSTLRTWLLAIARHRVLDALRAERRSVGQHQLDETRVGEMQDPLPSAVDSLDDRRLRQALSVCVAQLPELTRTALLLHCQGLSFEDMAEICAEKPGTLQARVARALPRLRAAVETLLGSHFEPPPSRMAVASRLPQGVPPGRNSTTLHSTDGKDMRTASTFRGEGGQIERLSTHADSRTTPLQATRAPPTPALHSRSSRS